MLSYLEATSFHQVFPFCKFFTRFQSFHKHDFDSVSSSLVAFMEKCKPVCFSFFIKKDLCTYLFERERGRDRKEWDLLPAAFIYQMSTTAGAWPDWAKARNLELPSGSPIWVVGTQVLENLLPPSVWISRKLGGDGSRQALHWHSIRGSGCPTW